MGCLARDCRRTVGRWIVAELWDALMGFFGQHGQQTQEQQAANAIAVMQGIQDAATLSSLWLVLPTPIRMMGTVIAAKDATQGRVDLQGENGIFGQMPKAMLDGFAALSGPMQTSLVELLSDALKPGSPKVTESIEGALDLLVDSALRISVPGNDADSVAFRRQASEVLSPILKLETTIGAAMCLAELIHPMKELGFGNLSHVFHDSFGFAVYTKSIVDPLARATVGSPSEKAINRLFQPYLPTQGELTGLARKYEITEEQYRDAMRGYGVKEEYIDALLTGFWADPRLREILLLAQVERPDPEPPQAAVDWLTHAGLEEYLGPDWWFALKFAKAGYDRIDIPVLIKVVRSQFLIKELGDLRTMRRAQYKSGQLSRAGYEEFLRGRGLREEELAPQLDAIEAERLKDQNDETQKLYELQYKNGRIDEAALTAALIGLGLAEERVTSRVEYLTTQKLGKLREDIDSRVPTRSDLEQTYKRGALTKEALIDRLDKMGYTIADAQLIADNAEADLIEDVATEWQRAYEERAKHRRMTIAALEEKMVGLGRSAAYADARSTYIQEGIGGEEGAGGAVEVDDAKKAEYAETIRAAEQAAKNGRMSIAELKTAYVTSGKSQAWADARAKYIEQLILGKV